MFAYFLNMTMTMLNEILRLNNVLKYKYMHESLVCPLAQLKIDRKSLVCGTKDSNTKR